jgi:hypothetical protein
MKTTIALAAAALLVTPPALAEAIDGVWKNMQLPVWIEVDTAEGTGTVVRNDQEPDLLGFSLLKNIVASDKDEGGWRAEVYARKLEEYKNADITLPDMDTMRLKVKVGFVSRTVDWRRAPDAEVTAGN